MSISPNLTSPATDTPHTRLRTSAALIVLVLVQFLVVFNGTSGNLALPDAMRDLHLSEGLAVWVVSGYVLSFGGLILLGGRLADIVGRRRLLLIGVVIFGVAATIAGLAPNGFVLVGARVLQGVGAAAMAPGALALISITFPEIAARRRALGVWGAVASAGSGLGVIGGGALTAWFGWRAALLVNLPFAIVLLIAIPIVIAAAPAVKGSHASATGALLSVLGLGSLIAGLTVGSEAGWTAVSTLVLLTIGVVLLVALVALEPASSHPFIPRHLLTRWPSAGGPIAILAGGFALYPLMLTASVLLQTELGYSPLAAGAMILPISVATLLGATFTPRIVARLGALRPVLIGLLTAAIGTAAFAVTAASGTSLATFLPATILFGVGMGITITSAITLTLSGAAPAEYGTASGLAQTGQQLGGALGLTLITALTAGAATRSDTDAGYGIGLGISAVVVLLGITIIAIGNRHRHAAAS